MSKHLIKTFLLLSISIRSLGTEQVKDKIIIDNDTFTLFSNPLDSYLNINLFNEHGENGLNSACLRNYSAYWTIRDDSLLLTKIQINCGINNEEPYDIVNEFGTKYPLAKWFSGQFYCAKGIIIHSFQNNSEILYETEILFDCKNGIITNRQKFKNRKVHQSSLTIEQFKLEEFIYENIDWDNFPSITESEILFVAIKSGSTIKPDSIWLVRASDNNRINDKVLEAFGKINDWDIYERRNEIYNMTWIAIIEINQKTKEKYAR